MAPEANQWPLAEEVAQSQPHQHRYLLPAGHHTCPEAAPEARAEQPSQAALEEQVALEEQALPWDTQADKSQEVELATQ